MDILINSKYENWYIDEFKVDECKRLVERAKKFLTKFLSAQFRQSKTPSFTKMVE